MGSATFERAKPMSTTAKYRTQRREERYKVRVPITLKMGNKSITLYSSDVSFRGLFICTDNPPVLRQLISIEAELPPEQIPFRSHGMSVYVLQPGQDPSRLPGVGVQFYAQSESERRKWERFVGYIRQNPPTLTPEAIDPVKRRHPRFDARFEVHPRDICELEVLYSRDISAGGMFLETDVDLAVGKRLALSVYHPLTRQPFTIDSIVKRRSDQPPKGLGVEFTDLNSARLREFQAFIKDGLAVLDEQDRLKASPDNAR